MKCPEFQDQLQHRLDGAPVTLAADVQQHLAGCPPCRQLDAAARRLEAGLRILPPPTLPEGLTDRIVAAVLRDRGTQLRFRRRLVIAASLAASLLLVVAGYARFHFHSNPASPSEPTPVAVAPPVPDAGEQPAKPPEASLNDSMAEAGSAVVALTKRTAGETMGGTRILLPNVPSGTLVEGRVVPRELVDGRPAQSLQESRHGMMSGIEPVTTSARRAVDLFLNELPPMEPERKPGL